MAAISCNALGAVGVVASARAPVASRGAVAAMPVRTQAKSVGFGSEAQRRGLAMNAARGRSTRGARGFEVVAQAISEVRTAKRAIHRFPRTRTRSDDRDAPRDATPGASHAWLSSRQNPEPRENIATRRVAGSGGLGAARPRREGRARRDARTDARPRRDDDREARAARHRTRRERRARAPVACVPSSATAASGERRSSRVDSKIIAVVAGEGTSSWNERSVSTARSLFLSFLRERSRSSSRSRSRPLSS